MRVLYFAEIKEILEMNSEDIDLIEDLKKLMKILKAIHLQNSSN